MKKQTQQQKLPIKTLTEKEKLFANIYVDSLFSSESKTNTEIAIAAGYAPESAYQRGYENTTYKLKPHVVNYIEELKEDFRIRNQITPEKHMARLNDLGRKAEIEKMYGVSLNAEVYRGKMAGYYVEKKLIANQNINDLTEEQLEERLSKMQEDYTLITNHEVKDETK